MRAHVISSARTGESIAVFPAAAGWQT